MSPTGAVVSCLTLEFLAIDLSSFLGDIIKESVKEYKFYRKKTTNLHILTRNEDKNLKIQKSEEKTLKNHKNSEKNKENFAKAENNKNKTSLKQQLLSKLNIFGIFVLVITALVLMFFRYYIVSIVCVILAYIWFRVFAYFINKNKIDDDKGKK